MSLPSGRLMRTHPFVAPARGSPSLVGRWIANPVRFGARGFKSPSPRTAPPVLLESERDAEFPHGQIAPQPPDRRVLFGESIRGLPAHAAPQERASEHPDARPALLLQPEEHEPEAQQDPRDPGREGDRQRQVTCPSLRRRPLPFPCPS